VLLLGGSGQVGSALARHLDDCLAPTREQFDLAGIDQGAAVELIRDSGADVVVNCAAYTAVARAESEPAVAAAINGTAVGVLAAATAETGARFVTYSTDYVFDGRATAPYVESAIPGPINAYGRSKLLGEHLALEANPESLVIRTSWVISATHPNFVSRILKRGEPTVEVVDDQFGSPTIASDLAAASIQAIAARATGVLHLANQGSTTWYRLAVAAFQAAGMDTSRLRAILSASFPSPPRPRYTVLGSERLDSLAIDALPPWESSLTGVVGNLKGL
jgi:dTDP-4-dehydrorhamnose reductase